jgi:peptidyl-prolyl cis-trans isomerase C
MSLIGQNTKEISEMPTNFELKKPVLALAVLASIFATGCSGKMQVEDKSPLSANIVRLGDTAVAEVEGTNIYLSDIEHSALAKGLIETGMLLTPKDPVFQSELDELIDQRLLALEALRQSLDQNDETRRRLAASRERILSNIVVENLLATNVTDETVKRMFDEQATLRSGTQQVRARHIVVASEAKAVEVRDLIDRGGDFAALAKEYSLDNSTRDLGGDLSYFSKDTVAKTVSEQAFSLKKGELSFPFETKQGWHVLRVDGQRQAPQPKFEDIKAEIVTFMTYDEIEKKLKTLRADSNIQLKLGNENLAESPSDEP